MRKIFYGYVFWNEFLSLSFQNFINFTILLKFKIRMQLLSKKYFVIQSHANTNKILISFISLFLFIQLFLHWILGLMKITF